ncbi:hypothetical protein OHB35_53260 [Streptomyces phaeochromogenes]|uniref:Uncharacterized protein n=1 Tax=Streptomyces phaeochromogenes TaxID=1923 RepID=A0ABZ1HRS5_STRPH|nr:hypothetical protein [Streptomyces phaeochromogenes]WSD11742.1 hypothetical protein OHB35_00075 [Streptomyces phaeochromogenes]WSD21307.1 hypothetical protein OHB35_53260 [Streptomyces phaeochromogenes]
MTSPQAPDSNTDEEVATVPLARLRAAGIRCLPWRDSAGTYIRVPLTDGTEVTFSGTAVDHGDTRGHDVSTHHPVRDHHSWQASLDTGGGCDDLYDSHDQGLPHEEDTTALVAAIRACAREHGGPDRTSSPDT